MEHPKITITLLVLLICEIVLLGWVISADGQKATETSDSYTPTMKVNDKPVLNSYEQINYATTRGICSFYCGDTHYLVENLPQQYIDYSQRYLDGTL